MNFEHLADIEAISSAEFFTVPGYFLRFAGVRLVKISENLQFAFSPMFYLLIVNIVVHTTLMGTQLYLIIHRHPIDALEFCLIVGSLCYWLVGLSKLIPILNPQFHRLFHSVDRIFPKTVQSQLNYEINKCLKQTQRTMWTYSTTFILMASVFGFLPFYNYYQNYQRTGHWNIKFPFSIWYPFDSYQSKIFPVVFAFQLTTAFTATILTAVGDIMLLAIVNQICSHFKYWRKTFMEKKSGSSNLQIQTDFIKVFVKQHIDIIG